MAAINHNKRAQHSEIIGTSIKGLHILDLYYINYTPLYNYKCLVCNNVGKITWYCISKKLTNGCWKCINRLNAYKKWGGHGEISGTFFDSLNSRNKEFTVTIEYIWDLFLSQSRTCALSGIPLKFASTTSIRDGNASLDRIDNNHGYVPGNVRWVDKNINMMRRKLSDNDFNWFCTKVAIFNKDNILTAPNVLKPMVW